MSSCISIILQRLLSKCMLLLNHLHVALLQGQTNVSWRAVVSVGVPSSGFKEKLVFMKVQVHILNSFLCLNKNKDAVCN